MKFLSLTVNAKYIFAAVSVVVVTTSVAVPIAVIYGTQNNSALEDEVRNDTIDVTFGTDLPTVNLPNGYDSAVLTSSNYTPFTNAGERNIFANYTLLPSASVNNLPKIILNRTVTITKAPTVPPEVLSETISLPFGIVPESIFVKKAKVNGFDDWVGPVYEFNNSIINSAQVENLAIGNEFSAKFSATPDLNHAGATIEYTYLATKTKGEVNFEPVNLTGTKVFGSNQPNLDIPLDVSGYQTWVGPIWANTNGQPITDFTTLPVGTVFTAQFSAAPDPKYNGPIALHTTTFTVTKATIVQTTEKSADLMLPYHSQQLPTADAPLKLEGFDNWDAPVISNSDFANLNAGETFTVTYTAKPDSNHTGTDAIFTITYTIKPIAAPNNPSGTNSANYKYSSNTITDLTPVKAENYLDWTGPVYHDALSDELLTLENIKLLNVGSKFEARYEASPDLNHTGTVATYVVTYTVVASDVITPYNVSVNDTYVYSASVLNVSVPLVKQEFYNDWEFIKYVDSNDNPVEFSAIMLYNVNTTFKAIYEATPDSNHTGSNAVHTIIYKVVPNVLTSVITQEISANIDFSETILPQANVPGIIPNYQAWSSPTLSVTTFYELDAGNVFTAKYEALPDANHAGSPIATYTITYTIQKVPVPLNPSGEDVAEYVYATPAPTNLKPADAFGYEPWSDIQYIDFFTNIPMTAEEVQQLNSGLYFYGIYTTKPDANHIGDDATFTILYAVNQAEAIQTGEISTTDGSYIYGTSTISEDKLAPPVPGYSVWAFDNYKDSTNTIITIDDIKLLNVDEIFSANYITFPDVNHYGEPAIFSIFFPVQKAVASIPTNAMLTKNLSFTKNGTNLPATPTAPVTFFNEYTNVWTGAGVFTTLISGVETVVTPQIMGDLIKGEHLNYKWTTTTTSNYETQTIEYNYIYTISGLTLSTLPQYNSTTANPDVQNNWIPPSGASQVVNGITVKAGLKPILTTLYSDGTGNQPFNFVGNVNIDLNNGTGLNTFASVVFGTPTELPIRNVFVTTPITHRYVTSALLGASFSGQNQATLDLIANTYWSTDYILGELTLNSINTLTTVLSVGQEISKVTPDPALVPVITKTSLRTNLFGLPEGTGPATPAQMNGYEADLMTYTLPSGATVSFRVVMLFPDASTTNVYIFIRTLKVVSAGTGYGLIAHNMKLELP